MQRSDIYDDLRQRTDLVERAIAHIKFIANQRCLRRSTPTHQQKL
ncbi:MAG: hypothetical protein V7L09_04675 [Nostoc sp.]